MRFARPVLSSNSARGKSSADRQYRISGRWSDRFVITVIAHRKPAVLGASSVWSSLSSVAASIGLYAGASVGERGRYTRSLLSIAWMIRAFLFASATAARL